MNGKTNETHWLNSNLWEQVQARLKDVSGVEGIKLRSRQYAPFFQTFGRGVVIEEGCWFSSPWRIGLDDGVHINRQAIFEGSSAIQIGRNTRIGHRFFIHSANHDIAVGSTAFFERGYQYKPVVIGDNVLISACVSVMPGTNIGSGSFVAANALVRGVSYPPDSNLRGVPATADPRKSTESLANFTPSAEFAFIGKRDKPHLIEGARLLATVLGCPQITVQTDDKPLAESVRVVVLLDDAVDASRFKGVIVWRLVDGQPAAGTAAGAALRTLTALPDEIEHKIVFNGFGDEPTLLNATRSCMFYCLNRHAKAPQGKLAASLPQWLVCRAMAVSGNPDDSRWQNFFETLSHDLDIDLQRLDASALDTLIRKDALKPLAVGIKEGEPAADKAEFAALRRVFHGAPHLLPLWAFLNRSQPEIVAEMNKLLSPAMNTSERKAALGCAYRLIGDFESAATIRDLLLSPEWRLPNSCSIRMLTDRVTVNVSPVLLAFLADELVRSGPTQNFTLNSKPVPLTWSVVEGAQDPMHDKAALFFQAGDHTISRSLFENWLRLQELPAIQNGHFYLSDDCYRFHCTELEEIWRRLVRCALGEAGRPTIQLKPWPADYRFALAVRYDVDRDVPPARVLNTIEIQKRHCGAACGSWYFIVNAPFNDRIQSLLHGWNQEYAVHARRAAECPAGQGVTAHSGADSEYWRGRKTIEQLESLGADYAEAMIIAFTLPRPGWFGDKRSTLWLTPLHFPLEGSTADTDTSYFDQRLDAFWRQREAGGLVIIGTHPDCNEAILDEVLGREDLEGAWPTTVKRAVDRVRAIFDYGAIESGYCGAYPDKLCLRSKHTLADVRVMFFAPGNEIGDEHNLQLVAGLPRPLQDQEQQLQQARILIRNKSFADAIPILKPILAAAPHNQEAYWLLAQASYSTGNWSEAAATAKQAKDLNPSEAKYHALLARALVKLGDLPGAEAAWRAALQDRSAPATWHAGLAWVCQVSDNFAEAIQEYEYAIAHSTSAPGAWMRGLGVCALRTGNYERALTTFREAAKAGVTKLDGITRQLVEQLQRLQAGGSAIGELPAAYYDDVFISSDAYQEKGERAIYLPLWNDIIDSIKTSRKDNILDIGCGPGQFAEFLHEHLPQIHYTGLDFSRIAIDLARERCPSFQFVQVDIFASDVMSTSNYEIVVCTETLEHVERDLDVIKRIRPGTTFLGSVPNFYAFGHVRYFSTDTEVTARYAQFFDNFSVKPVAVGPRATLFLMKGIRNQVQ